MSRKTLKKGVGRRKAMNGAVLYVSTASLVYGPSERSLRGMIARGTIPYRRMQSRVVMLRSELDQFFSTLPGVSLDEARKNAAARREGG